jgi:exosome complex component RRP41
MRDLVSSVAVGKVDDTIVLDLMKDEDNYGTTDMPIAMLPRKKVITLLQMDGHFTQEEFERAIELAMKGCEQIYEAQKQALKAKYETRPEEG